MSSLPTTFPQAFSTNLLTLTKFRDLLKKSKRSRPTEDLSLLRRAYQFSAHYHMPQVRASGAPFLSHPLEVAHILADLRLDVRMLAATYLGRDSLAALASGGLVDELRPGALAATSTALRWHRAPISIEVF